MSPLNLVVNIALAVRRGQDNVPRNQQSTATGSEGTYQQDCIGVTILDGLGSADDSRQLFLSAIHQGIGTIGKGGQHSKIKMFHSLPQIRKVGQNNIYHTK